MSRTALSLSSLNGQVFYGTLFGTVTGQSLANRQGFALPGKRFRQAICLPMKVADIAEVRRHIHPGLGTLWRCSRQGLVDGEGRDKLLI